MQKVSRSLLLAGVLAFGTLTAACSGDKVIVNPPIDGVQSVTVSPSNASIPVGTSITLAANVTATGNAAKTVTWTSSDATVATVDATGKVAGVKAGTVTVTATATADPNAKGAAAIVITPTAQAAVPSIAINSVTQGGAPVLLTNAANQIDITVNTSGGGLIDVYLSSSCTTNTISASDTPAATQQATSAQPGTVTLSVNTAAVTASNAPKYANGDYCIKARLTSGTQTVVATNTTAITLNNKNVFNATFSFASQTGGPGIAVGANGLNYREGTMTVTLTPVIFTSATPVAQISGYFTRNGEQAGGVSPGNAGFTAATPTAGAFSVAFTDTGSTAGVRSIFQYTSLPAGDTLYITAATDAAGNQIAVLNNQFAVPSVSGIRVDNDIPNIAASTFTVTAPNGYIGAAYSFASGTTTAPLDNRGGVTGVNTVTTTYYVGAAGTPAATWTAGSCVTTGLTAANLGSDLANTNSITVDQAKVVVKDALGNQVCAIVPVTTTTGSPITFGVDKILPTVVMVGPTPANAPTGFVSNNGASANTGYAVSKNFSFVWQDSISGFTNAVVTTPLKGTLTKNFFTAGTSPVGDCVIGTYAATPKTCAAVAITATPFTTAPGNVAPWNVFSIEFTNGTAVPGYYSFTGAVSDLAGNVSGTVTRLAAFDNVAPAIGALTQSPTALVPLGTVTVSGTATDNVDLTSTSGRLSYATATNAIPFKSVAGTSFGPNFVAAVVTSASASVALPNVYRGMQTVSGTNVITAGGVTPTATVTVTDVGTNVSAPATLTIATSTAKADILLNSNTFSGASTVPAPATTAATTTLSINVGGLVSDPAFQNQPFAQVDIYKLVSGELVLVASNTSPVVTDAGTARTYTYTVSGVALTAAATNTFYAVGRNSAGDAVISNPFTVVNP
jgi:hypothetical protein